VERRRSAPFSRPRRLLIEVASACLHNLPGPINGNLKHCQRLRLKVVAVTAEWYWCGTLRTLPDGLNISPGWSRVEGLGWIQPRSQPCHGSMASANRAPLKAEPEAHSRPVVGPIVIGVRPIIVGVRPIVGIRSIVRPVIRIPVRVAAIASITNRFQCLHACLTLLKR
jgi:hypothetical protein